MDYPVFRLDDRQQGHRLDLSKVLAAPGAVVAVAARDIPSLERLANEIWADGGDAIAVQLDVRDTSGTRISFDWVRRHFGSLDVLDNNVGLGAKNSEEDVTEFDWHEMTAVDLRGLFFACQAAGRIMLAQGEGRIVNIGLQAGVVCIRDHVVHSASKGGVNLLTKVPGS
jgi:2-deoxy-D-gluconate 3-dehydrogenase